MMALAASLVAVYTACAGFLFFPGKVPDLPEYYLWAIRFGIIIFVIFSFEGFVMGSKLTHTIGGNDGCDGICLVDRSKTFGDPRVAQFIGMHALQLLPLISYYALKNTKMTIGLTVVYCF